MSKLSSTIEKYLTQGVYDARKSENLRKLYKEKREKEKKLVVQVPRGVIWLTL